MARNPLLKCLLLASVAWAALPLPPSIHKCPSKERTALNACALKNARALMEAMKEGDRKYGIQSVAPLRVERIAIDNNGLSIAFTDVVFGEHGRTPEVVDVDIDLESNPRRLSFTYFHPLSIMKAKYEVNGRLLVIPIRGKGDCEIKLDNMRGTYSSEFIVEKSNKDGLEYVKLQNLKFTITTTRANYRFENLFNGDERISNTTHQFVNENWAEVFEETIGGPEEALKAAYHSNLQHLFDAVPYKDAFPE